MRLRPIRGGLTGILFVAAAWASGCRGSRGAFDLPANSARWSREKTDARLELSTIPPPRKGLLAAGAEESGWKNPFLTVGSGTIQLRIFLADQNMSEIDRGGLTRLDAARKQVLDVRLKDLPRALSSLPQDAWPYGRVIAINEALEPANRASALDANLNLTAKTVEDLGIAVVEANATAAAR